MKSIYTKIQVNNQIFFKNFHKLNTKKEVKWNLKTK